MARLQGGRDAVESGIWGQIGRSDGSLFCPIWPHGILTGCQGEAGGRMTINEQKSLETSCVRVCTYCSRGPSRRLERTDKLLWTREPPLTLYVVILASRVERVQTGGRMVL